MPRLLFTKKGNAVWISHLDLMRVFQRAFKRAGLPLTHTQGFNPRPSVSIALPLSVGVSSDCELLDFNLTSDEFTCDEIKNRLNGCLIEGVNVLDVYDGGKKLRDLALLDCEILLHYDTDIPQNADESIRALFQRPVLVMNKKTKTGVQETDILPMIRNLCVERVSDRKILINARICCQNPALNPTLIASAVSTYLPELTPEFVNCHRVCLYDTNETQFK